MVAVPDPILGGLAAVLAAVVVATASADSPGQLVMSKPYPGVIRHLTHSLERYRSIERCAAGDILASVAPLPLIRADGTLVVLGTPGLPLTSPPADLGQVIRAAVSVRCGAAIKADGSLACWPQPARQLALPTGPWRDLDACSAFIAGLTLAGDLHVWSDSGLVPHTEVAPGARRVTLHSAFGTTLDEAGSLAAFGINGAAAPSVPPLRGLRMVEFPLGSASAAIERGVAIRHDGTLIGVTLPFSATTPSGYVDASLSRPPGTGYGVARIAALRGDGTVDEFSETATGWNDAPTQWYGRFDSALLTNTNRRIGIWTSDADRDGEPDQAQIERGEIPDANGDGIDDRIQVGSPVHDGNRNGRMDAEDSATICGDPSHGADYSYFFSGGSTHAVFELVRVPQGAGIVRGVKLLAARTMAPSPATATYCIWRDPNGDGSPDDAVLVSATPVTLSAPQTPSGLAALSFPISPVYVGKPGDVLFHGFVYYDSIPLTVAPTRKCPEPVDLATAPLNASLWAATMTGPGHDPTTLLRQRAKPLYLYGYGYGDRERFQIAMRWGERRPLDCDESGLLDSAQADYQVVYDLDADGVIDACEGDCDSDGIQDVTEIALGAADCDRNLRLDTCDEIATFTGVTPVPAPGSVATLESGPIGLPAGSVFVNLNLRGDFSAPTEFVTFQLGNRIPQQVPDLDTADCASSGSGLVVPAAEWISAMENGRMRMTIRSSSFVDPAQCPTGEVRVWFTYDSAGSDCDGNGALDPCEAFGRNDCNGNGVPDSCELAGGAADVDGDGRLDACELDCNSNSLPDQFELASGIASDCDGDGQIDSCEGGDCDADGIPDRCEVLAGAADCNGDLVPDACQGGLDCDMNGIIDACDHAVDCDNDGRTDACQVVEGDADKDGDLRPDNCEYARCDFNLDDRVDGEDLVFILSTWGTNAYLADVNDDGIVNGADLGIALSLWGPLY